MSKRTVIKTTISWLLVFSLVFSLGAGVYADDPAGQSVQSNIEVKEVFKKPPVLPPNLEEEYDEYIELSLGDEPGIDIDGIAVEIEGIIASKAAVGFDASECTLERTMTALVKDFGVRYYGTPNEKNAANYVKNEFAGYGSYVAEVVEIPLKFPGGYLYPNSIQRPGVVELIDGPWIMGRPMPNNATFGSDALGDFSGVFHDFGTFPNISLPDGLNGNVYGALRIDGTGTAGAVTLANIQPFFNEFNNKYGGDAKLTGLFISRTGAATGAVQGVPIFHGIPANIANIPVNTVGLTLADLENVVAAGKSGNIKDVFRFEPKVAYAAYATKPAATDEPDLVLVISAHLDGVWGAPSANDNASGVSALIELARRFDKVDLGNIELIFAAVGGEEYGDFEGASYLCERLEREGKIARGATGSASTGSPGIGVNLNMDMIAPALNATTSGGAALRTVYAGNQTNAQNLASYLLIDDAASVVMPKALEGIITNVMFNAGGASDYMMFRYFGMDATSLNHGLERGYHTGFDNMEDNYSYDRHLYSVDLMTKAIQKAIDQELTKRARFATKYEGASSEISLINAEQMFKTYNSVSARFTGKETGAVYELTFTGEAAMFKLPGAEEFSVSGITAAGRGTGNMATGAAGNFTTRMVGSVSNITAVTSIKISGAPTVTVERGKVYNFDLALNFGAAGYDINWSASDPSFVLVNNDDIYILNKTGTVRLIATDLVSGNYHSITLRIAS